MNTSIQSVIGQLEAHIRKAHESGKKYDFIDPAYELCLELEGLEDPAGAIEPLLRLIERSADIDYGGPGPLGQFLEAFAGGIYEEQLLQSLQRKPTLYTVSLLDTLLQDSNDPQQGLYLDTMRAIAVNPDLPDAIRQEATNNLQYALEHLHAWDDAFKAQLDGIKALMEQTITRQEQQQQLLPDNEPLPPAAMVNYNGIPFKVITRRQAAAYLPAIGDLPGLEQLYDVWDEWRFPAWRENAYFLLAEGDLTTEKLELDYEIPGHKDINVLGFIFTGNLFVSTYILAFDTDHSPALIVHGAVQCPCIHLFGNVHYIGGKVSTDLVWAKYNHGELYLNGSVDARVIFADDMPVFIRHAGNIKATISRMGMNIYIKTGAEWLQNPATRSIEDVFLPEICVTDKDGDLVLKEEGVANALDYIRQYKTLLR